MAITVKVIDNREARVVPVVIHAADIHEIIEPKLALGESANLGILERLERTRLARECAKLDPLFEQQLADEGLAEDLEQWPEY